MLFISERWTAEKLENSAHEMNSSKQIHKKCWRETRWRWRCDRRKESSQKASQSTHSTKRCNKIRFQQFRVSTVATAFLCLIDTWFNILQFKGENKVISRFITIEIQRVKKPGREMNAEAIFNNIFSVHHV